MIHDAPCLAELEQARLILLNRFATEPPKHHPGNVDGLCFFCGCRPRAGKAALCAPCEGRRQMLQARYPEITISGLRDFASTTTIYEAHEWSPHNSE